ncbi:sensor domain-containing diguanylate cyclase [Psychromonas sp. Urea-02u-13]|uniref:sensor domain-containing diguanylate cyclase n=1 Tax=Psychromonas sp. Urea-02u-13 TaxID=2058326 RepID=UPI000C320085|nr:sensor domain-containing diguanylate cyclase [Psychromonas sp. Urea-02u-13]PKG37771.1 sensor domain-containing diguanylate cyclase [Psychromonas sp. Urea-02u-13]
MDSQTFQQMNKAFDYLFDALVVTDLQGIITDWNKGSESLYGYSKEEAIGQPVNILHLPEDTNHITAEVISAVEKVGKWTGEVRMLHKDGHIGWIESMCVPIFDANDHIIGALGVNRNISDRVNNTQRLEHLAHYDHLTKIPNRHLLFERLKHLIVQSKRNNSCFALLFIDLDKFKFINDSKGHIIGDQVLVQTALRLKQSIRDSDTVARVGGDEFVILLENITNKNNVLRIIETITDTLQHPFSINNEVLSLSCSIGFSIYPNDGDSTDALIAVADKAMYHEKNKRNGTAVTE